MKPEGINMVAGARYFTRMLLAFVRLSEYASSKVMHAMPSNLERLMVAATNSARETIL
jgi:hypothetical protein